MMRLRVFLLLLFLSLSGFAWADARSDAKAAMEEGASFYKKKKFEEAIASYQKALVAFPEAPGPYREIAKCYKELKQAADAIDNFTEYLSRRPDAPERDAIEEAITELRGQLPTQNQALLSVETDPDGSVVYVIDKSGKAYGIGVAPIEDHPVDPGITKVRVVRAYFEPEEKPVSLKANAPTEVKVVLSAAGSKPKEVAAPVEPPKGYILLGSAAASGIGAATVGLLFIQARQDFKLVPASDPAADEKQLKQQHLANISDALTGVALITGGVGAYLFLKHQKFTKQSETKSAVVPTSNGLAVIGHF
jgi:tetratricopeptide (TPR) repeat protein